jgi:hypothetical protein
MSRLAFISLDADSTFAGPTILDICGIGNVGATFSSGCRNPLASIIFFVELLIYSGAFGFFGWLLGGQHDNLRIKTEFRFTTIFCAIASIPWFTASVIPAWQSLVVIQYPIIPLWSGARHSVSFAKMHIPHSDTKMCCDACFWAGSVHWLCHDMHLPVLSIIFCLSIFQGCCQRGIIDRCTGLCVRVVT